MGDRQGMGHGIIVIMGVSGVGKTTVAQAVAAQLDLTFVEGDTLHPQANRDKMSRGEGLTDDDRWPWLDRVAQVCRDAAHHGRVVVTCSALKRRYRDHLRAAMPELRWVYLRASPSTVEHRVASRQAHFASPKLVPSQFAALEEPDDDEAITIIEADRDLPVVIANVTAALTAL